MVLSDRSISEALASGRLVVDPIGEAAVQPASLDIRLDRFFRVFRNHREAYIDVHDQAENLTEGYEIDEDEPFVLHPGEFVLGSTLERVELADDLVARIEGKSSLGRIGLLVHATAGYVDPGWNGKLTLELSNVATLPIRLYYRMKIGQTLLPEPDHGGRAPIRSPRSEVALPGSEPPHGEPHLSRLRAARLATGCRPRPRCAPP